MPAPNNIPISPKKNKTIAMEMEIKIESIKYNENTPFSILYVFNLYKS